MRHLDVLQCGRAVGRQRPETQVPRASADGQPDCGRPAGDPHRDARGCCVEHHGPVAGWRPGLQVPDVPQAPGHVLLCLRHCGDQSGQAVGHPQPSGHQHGPQKEQGHADGGLDDEHLAVHPSGKRWAMLVRHDR